MAPKVTTRWKEDIEYIKSCISDKFSCVKHIRKSIHIPLSPVYIGDEVKGVLHLLNCWKRQYIKSLQGVLIGFQNISFVQSQGLIITDQPFIHLDVAADFYVFQPVVGSIIRGKINRLSPEHVGCVALGCINVSIQLTRCLSPELIPYLRVGQEVFLKVSSIDFQRKILHIGGKITNECIQFMKDIDPHPQVVNGEKVVSEDSSSFHSVSHDDNSTENKNDLNAENSLIDCGTTSSTTSLQDSMECLNTEDVSKHKSVKKKDKHKKKIKTSPKKSQIIKNSLSQQSSTRKDKTKKLKKKKQNKLAKKKLKNDS
ncbi:RNA polymerase I subunit F [Tachypleus tridentatus]|uniref:RNA polymerase I subunit F n=1 Tax=Tachypleus tridentatus TaxID=6853 RepID=UPI003FD01A37